MENSFRISDLIAKKLKGILTDAEQDELDTWVNGSARNSAIYKNATDPQKQLAKLEMYTRFNKEKAWKSIEEELFSPKVILLFSAKFMKYAAAILIPLMLAGGVTYFFLNKEKEEPLTELNETIKPGVQKATLVLSNGESHILDTENTMSGFVEVDAQISTTADGLSYVAANGQSASFKAATYNELFTPKGGNFRLKLADGSTVWLNAESRLSFPVAFTDSTRHLFLEGEAYFEVAHNGSPFIVTSGEMDIRVMGTSFNVSAYPDDVAKKTTLVEGKVRVDVRKENEVIQGFLTPNKQATVSTGESGISIADVDAAQYKSWVDGKFEFKNETLEQVMKKLARWYDFEYQFSNQSAKNFHFSGRLDNQEKISSIFKMLEMTTNVKFNLQENGIVVK